MDSFSRILDSFPDSNTGKGVAFEVACREFLIGDSVWSNTFDPLTVHLWKDSPFRTGADIGIDLTAEDRTGGVWAIQAKNWKRDTPIPKSEVDKFLSASNTSVFSRRLLITTTDFISGNALRAISEQEKPVSVLRRADLEASSFWSRYNQNSTAPPPVKKLRPHQKEAVSAAVKGLVKHQKGQLVMACGTGKTLTGLRIAEEIKGELSVVLLPSLLLVEQTLRSWLEDANEQFLSLAVCSDPTVSEKAVGDATSSLELGIPVTTDNEEISKFLSLRGKKVVFSTYQSQGVLIKSLNSLGLVCDLVIADEAHRLAGLPGADFSLTFDEETFRRKNTLFMTATPRVFSTKAKAKATDRGSDIVSMDSERFGSVLHRYSFREAIEDGVLSDYRIAVIGVSDQEVAGDIEDNESLRFNGITAQANEFAAHVALDRANQKHGVRTAISFHSRINSATQFAANHALYLDYMYNGSVPAWCIALSGKTPVSERQRQLGKLNAISEGVGLISNARCLTEGVDVPNLDAVLFVNPRQSTVDIIQAVGRAIRKGKNQKEFGWIILPLLVDSDGGLIDSKRTEQFTAILSVIQAMKAHDEALVDELNAARQKLGAGIQTEALSEKLIFELPKAIGIEFAAAIELEILRDSSDTWFEWFGRARKAAEEMGTAFIPTAYSDSSGYAVGSWIGRQRTSNNRESLSHEKASLLESLPGWVWDAKDAWWEDGLSALREFQEIYGHVNVPQKHVTADGFNLGTWFSNRRKEHREGRLAEERIVELQGFEGYSPDLDDKWEISFGHFLEAVDENGTADLRVSLECHHGVKVGSWMSNQRAAYRRGELTPQQIRSLEELPSWEWQKKTNQRELFIRNLQQLARFLEEQGRYPSASSQASEDEKRIAEWVGSQRKRYRNGRLSEEAKREILARLPTFVWSQKDEDWLRKLDAYKQFLKEKGDVHVPIRARVNDVALASFIDGAIAQRDNGTLPEWKQRLLDETNDWYGKNKHRPGRWD